MSDDEFTVMMFMIMGMGLMILRLLWTNRKLKKRLRAIEAPSAPVAAPIAAAAPPPERSSEIDQLRQRVQVLERIATDGNPLLVREIEALRSA